MTTYNDHDDTETRESEPYQKPPGESNEQMMEKLVTKRET